MKHLLLFTIILTIVIITQPAFAQPDSLNMTLLDEWEIPGLEHAGVSPSPFCFIDSFIVVAGEDSTFILTIDSLDHFIKLATHNFESRQILSRDSLLFVTSSGKFSIYDFNNPYDIDSIGACTNDGYISPILEDSIIFYDHSWNLGSIDIQDISNPFNENYSNHYPISPSYGPFFDGRYLYICGKADFGDIYEEYSKAVLEVYDPYTYADSIAYLGRYFFGPDEVGSFKSSDFVEFIQDSFMIFGDSPNVFSLMKVNMTRDSFDTISMEIEPGFGPTLIKTFGDSLAFILGGKSVYVYDISNLPEYNRIAYYKLERPCTYSFAIDLPYIIVQYHEDLTPTETPIKVLLLKYTPSDGMNCSYNAKEENDFNIFPNPFNSSCSIELANNTQSIEITDIRGNTVKSIENPTSFNWQPDNLPSGLYFITVDFGETKVTKKTVYLR